MARWSQAKREEVRATILVEARKLFEGQGFEQTTMRQVAQASGLAVGTVFNYFTDKRALLYEALYEELEAVLRSCIATMPATEEGLEVLLVHSAGCFFDYYTARPALSRALLKESLWATGDASVRFRSQVTALGKALAIRMTEHQARGDLAPEASIEQVLLAFFSHYYFILLSELPGTPDPARMRMTLAVLCRQLLAGVGPGEQDV